MVLLKIALFIGFLVNVSAFLRLRHNINEEKWSPKAGEDYGEPVFLTPYIQQGLITEGQEASRVGPLNGTERESYSGFLTVNPDYNSNLFFWYFPAEIDQSTAPVVIWLQGGPGSSSMFGLFCENGPFAVDENFNLYERDYDWGVPFNLIFFDNPVGAGFSFTDNDEGYAINETDVANDLYEALLQFFTLFPALQPLDFYATGESYAGKYVPAISYKIMQENPTANLKINLKGLAIGDGWIDPVTQFDYGDYLYNVGLIDKTQRAVFYEQQVQMVQAINDGDYINALSHNDALLLLYSDYTKLFDYYNYLRWNEPPDQNYYNSYLKRADVRKSIHVGNLTFSPGLECSLKLEEDTCQSTKPWLEELLDNNYNVLLYNGQLDIICAYYLTLNMINSLHWKGAADYRNANRGIWKVDPADAEIAGYVKNVQNFWEILVRDAGHILPYDQPRFAYDMITRFVFGQNFV
ncbi:hypothetical protein CHUAL_003661 [Chamberlinius hualienensis]